jgi:hypothetical protein
VLTPEQADAMIDTAPGNTYFWKLIISPDPKSENKDKNLDLRQLTGECIQWLEARLNREIPFIGAEHDDHTGIPHIHAIALIERRGREMLIDRDTINAMREFTTEHALSQNRAREHMAVLFTTPARVRGYTQDQKSARQMPAERRNIVTRRIQHLTAKTHTCTNCGLREGMVKLRSGVYWCKSCEAVEELAYGISPELSL